MKRVDSSADSNAAASINARPPAYSKLAIKYPFKSQFDQSGNHSVNFKESYQNPWNSIRIGKVLEDLDALAGNIAYMHVVRGGDQNKKPVIVTASVDRIKVVARPTMETDMEITGGVTAVGGSSVEIRMVAKCDHASVGSWLEAYFTFVALDSETNRPYPVVKLSPETDEEKNLEKRGLHRMDEKKKRRNAEKAARAQNSLTGSVEENEIAQALLAKGHALKRFPTLGVADSHVFMSETGLHNALVCQPQQRNMHGRIFGGFLMRRSYELAFSTAYAFIGKKPTFDEVDDIAFMVPVNVGDLCLFDSRVLYTLPKGFEHGEGGSGDGRARVFIEVIVLVASPETVSSKVSNRLYFTFGINDDTPVKQILPQDMSEAKRMAGRILADRIQVLEDDKDEAKKR